MLDPIAGHSDTEVLLSTAALVDGEVEVTWQDKVSRDRFSPFWLRDHCHGKESLHPETLQRQVDTFGIPEDIAPAAIEIRRRRPDAAPGVETRRQRQHPAGRVSLGALPKATDAASRRGGACGIAPPWAMTSRA